MYSFNLVFLILLQLKKRLPKVNRNLAARLLEEEDAQTENMEADGVDTLKTSDVKKTSKKKKGLTSEVLKDERFTEMFENKVLSWFDIC